MLKGKNRKIYYIEFENRKKMKSHKSDSDFIKFRKNSKFLPIFICYK